MQGAFPRIDVNRAVHWLNVASKNNLKRLAAKAERFIVQAAERLSDNPEALHIPPSLLLRMLDSRQAAIADMQKTAKIMATDCKYARIPCASKCTHKLPDAVEDALTRFQCLDAKYPNV
ncbi:hypothetical protein COCOBI_16-4100 [Coccomyxa sp. Obi]|nr:hypothetical protein COCOBI_16-4100 [Coccomyxa sp. Obi]